MRALTLLLALVSLPALAAGLNDTGIQFCGDYPSGNSVDCGTAGPAGQDRQYGRDAAAQAGVLSKTGGGEAGFDFTKVCMSGELAGQGACPADPALGGGANDWACTKDNVTGLIWEVKTDDSGLRDQDNTYTNYDDPTRNQKWNGVDAYVPPSQGEIDAATNSIGFVKAVNALTGASRLCGATDWRRPSKKALLSIVHLGRSSPAIDPAYFPNTPSWYFLLDSPFADASHHVNVLNFSDGNIAYDNRGSFNHVRLVRGGQ